MSYNKIIILGNLGRDAELRYTQQGKPVCNFSVATTEKWKGNDGQEHEDTIWFKCVDWRKSSENLAKYLTKGTGIYVEGRLKMGAPWKDRDGKERQEPEVNVSVVEFQSGGSRSGGGRNEYDQSRPGTDDHDQRQGTQASDALPLGGVNPEDDIPF